MQPYRTIELICDTLDKTVYWVDEKGKIAVKRGNVFDWYEYRDESRRFVCTGSTRRLRRSSATSTPVKYRCPRLRKTPKILLSLHHLYSKRDINGNVYWITTVTSTISGESIQFSTPSDSNSDGMAMQATGGEWGRTRGTREQIGSRDFWRRHKQLIRHNSCNDQDLVRDMRILAVGQKPE